MSDHVLAYSEEPLSHRFLVIFEAAGLASDLATYLLRSLLKSRVASAMRASSGPMAGRRCG